MPGAVRTVAIAAACLLSTGQGCSYRAWYEGFREQQRQECYRLPGEGQVRQCLQRAGDMSYEDYERARREAGEAEDRR